jgi:hypothetical protein
LPEAYALLYTKVFPHTLFSDSSSDEDDDRARVPVSLKLQPHHPQPTKKRLRSEREDSGSSRSRSRSLSISLEAERKASNNNAAANASKKRMLSREVSMSKVFRKSQVNQPNIVPTTVPVAKKEAAAPDKNTKSKKATDKERILVETTPVKASKRQQKFERTDSDTAVVRMDVDEDGPSMFAASTPVKGGRCHSSSPSIGKFLLAGLGDHDDEDEAVNVEEEKWMIGLPSLRAMSHTLKPDDLN